MSGKDAANANEYFEPFLNATTLKNILGYHRSMCEFLHLKPNVFTHFYPKLKANLTSWRAKALWKKFDLRASHKCYAKGKACSGTKVLVIGAGPCGLRTAIEAQLLGAKVVVVEKRDRLSRNNVLHLWPFVIEDLRMLGAKKFFGKFCAGAIDHISIRQLQCILLKVALLLGVEVHTEVSFVNLIEPNASNKTGWKADIKPDNHPVSQYEFDVIIGADGKRNTLEGFKRKEFRGKLAIAITANFINKKTEAEARVEEISGVAFIFNQKFFKDLQEGTRIDLENIVYYKDDTHYFVMTAKKASLLEKGVIKQDLADTEKLLAPDNVNREKLHQYAREAADFSTNYQMPDLEFAVNHYGLPDVAMFDFTSMYAAEYASKVVERNGHRLLMILVGDSLLEPFWPTGSGCARGFLSSLDAAWAIRSYSTGLMTPLDVLAERESIYRLLAQTTPDNLNKDWKAYTLDPATRYPNLNKTVVLPHQTVCLYDTDNPESVEKMKRASLDANTKHDHVSKKRRRGGVDNEVLLSWLSHQLRDHDDITITDIPSVFQGGKALSAIIHHYRPDLLDYSAIKDNEPGQCNQHAMDILEKDLGIPPFMTGEEITNTQDYLAMTTYLTQVYDTFRGEIPHIKHPKLELPPDTNKRSEFSIKSIKTAHQQQTAMNNAQLSRPSSRHKRHADLTLQKPSSAERKQRKRRTLERIGPSVDYDNRATGMKPLANTNADEDIASKIRSLEDKWSNPQPVEKKPKDLLRAIGKIETSDWNIKQIEKKILENKLGKPSTTVDKERVPRWSREEFVARQTKMENKRLERQDSSEAKYADIDKNIKQLELKLKEGTTRELGQNKVASITEKLVSKVPQEIEKPVEKVQAKPVNLPIKSGSEFCHFCNKKVYLVEKICAEGRFFHNGCFKCQYCHIQLRLGSYMFDRDGQFGHRFFCSQHYGMPGELPRPAKVSRKPSHRGARDISRSPSKRLMSGVAGVDLLDKVRTPERIEFSNISRDVSSEDEPLSQMDEDEWTDKNFGASCNELDESDGDSSSSLGTDSDDEDAYDDALEQPVTKEGTLKLAERWKKIYSKGKHSDLDAYSSSDDNSYYENSSDDSDSDTATEGEEEIRARELRKQEVRVEPPVVQTDTGTDTEVKTNLDYLPPDILSDHPSSFASLHKSPSNYSISSEVFKSAESDVDYNMNKTYVDPSVVVGKLTISKPPVDSSTKKSNPLARSATASSLTSSKPKRNFVLPPKEQRKSIGEVFQEKVKLDEPLLVIRRTPSKVTLPKEIKPKVAVNAKGLDTSKYFGLPKIPQKSKIKRGDTAVTRSRPPLIKQASLPETANEKNEATFNFDLKESDLDHVDDYIEDLLSKKDELEKPVDYSKYATQNHEDISPENEKEELSSSIEDLFKALEEVTDVPHREMQKESDEKIDDLLKFMEELDHQTPERKVYRSVSDVKYRNLERLLKSPQRSESVVSKLPRNNLSFFETILKGKETPRDSSSDENLAEPRTRGLCRSKTEIHFNRGNKKQRTSVDVDAVGKVDIKSVLKKFESFEQEDELKAPKPEKKIIKRMSLGNFRDLGTEGAKISKLPAILKPKPIGNTIQKFESEPKKFKKVEYKKREPRRVLTTKYDEKSYEDTIKDLEKFVDEAIGDIGASKKLPEVKSNELGKSKSDWCVNITVSSKVNPEFLKLQEKRAENPLTGVNNEQQTNLYDNVGSNVNSDILRLHDEKLDENSSKDQNIKQKNSILKDKSDEFNQDLDFSQEMKDFNEAMSALTEESTLDSTSEPHNFSKAVDSSDSSETENIEPVIGKITDNIPQVIITNGVPADIDDLYAKVNKCKPPLEPPPPVPHRRKHSHGELPGAPLPPPRAARQKSLEAKTSNNENVLPVAPHRRRSTTASPLLPRRKHEVNEPKPLDTNGRSTSTGNLEVKREVVRSFETAKPQLVTIRSQSSENVSKFPPKFGRKDKDKDCCIQ